MSGLAELQRKKRNMDWRCLIRFFILGTVLALSGFPAAAQAGERLVIGISPSLTATLSVIAEKQGFFTQQGLDVELRNVKAGNFGVLGMLNDEIDISESAIFSLVSNSFTRSDFKIITTVGVTGNDNMVIARGDRGIRRIQDLKGKKVGVLRGGFPQYVLDLMLLNAGLTSKDLRIIFEEPEALVRLVSSGELDAICCYGGWIDKTKQELKNNFIVFHDEYIVRVTAVQAAKTARIDRNPDIFARLMRAYILAEEYVKKNPARALKTTVDYFKMDMRNAQKLWKPNLCHVALDQSLIKDLENVARWQVDSGMHKNSKIPNYLDFIRFNILEGIDAKRITIIH